ncbi:MAG: D-lyxose/D-mannose family sugar isomerase [Anaerolineales bacterium]|nr:D-lyxose/D-mannose family sugar isomerase [Anaerolineales bacterium]
MKRSQINTILRSAKTFLRCRKFSLPPFAYRTSGGLG